MTQENGDNAKSQNFAERMVNFLQRSYHSAPDYHMILVWLLLWQKKNTIKNNLNATEQNK